MNINFKGNLLSLDTPLIMGILNNTEDSFFDGGQYLSEKQMLERAQTILEEGADLIDLGAMSTRPGAMELDEETEIARIRKGLSLILKHFPKALISVDTWRSTVAQIAVEEGAAMINDISGGTFDQKMFSTIGALKVPYCLMHTSGKPDVMQKNTYYQNIIADLLQFFGQQLKTLKELGVNDIILDPGFGFGKTMEQNYFLLNNLNTFSVFNLPILVGVSRKSMIYKKLDTTPEKALNGTTVVNTIALTKGANILRVHDVWAACECRKIIR
ncbi:MAG: dihydropteroate synthase [Bacteroidales bacterium]